MKILVFLVFFFMIGFWGHAQVRPREGQNDSLQNGQKQPKSLRELEKPKKERPPIDLYKIISIEGDTTIVDTSLTVHKFYKYNYLRRDRFDLLPFANTGQTNNTLVHTFDGQDTRPLFGARARHFNYMEIGDIDYYEVPTPLTELYYKSAFQQGQTLDAFFTMNTSRQFNFSIAYKGLRSLGKYQHILTSTGNFRFTFNYHSKNNKYDLKAHYVAQDLLNEENGGLTPTALQNFTGNDGQFNDRSRLEVNFEDAESILKGQRIYVNQSYELLPQGDSLKGKNTVRDLNNIELDSASRTHTDTIKNKMVGIKRYNSLKIGHILTFRDKFFEYRQAAPDTTLFGPSFQAADINDHVDLLDLNNQLYIQFDNALLGKLAIQANYTHYDYGYNSVLVTNDGTIPNRLTGNSIAAGARYTKNIGGFNLKSEAQANIAGDFDGYNLKATASYDLRNASRFYAGISVNSAPANYNHLLYQSSYRNYNWYNADAYNNVKTRSIEAGINSEKWLNASATLTNIGNYTYFGLDPADDLIKSFQASENLTYLKIKVNKEFRFGKFALNNTLAYQQVSSGKQYLNTPPIVTRNTLYYTDAWFDKALFIQTGINFKYFTKYNMDGYDPILAEFYVQNDTEIGDFPLIDFFFNMKVRQTRIFFIAEHLNSSLGKSNFFSAPGYPYRDFNIRFGIVWNFFL